MKVHQNKGASAPTDNHCFANHISQSSLRSTANNFPTNSYHRSYLTMSKEPRRESEATKKLSMLSSFGADGDKDDRETFAELKRIERGRRELLLRVSCISIIYILFLRNHILTALLHCTIGRTSCVENPPILERHMPQRDQHGFPSLAHHVHLHRHAHLCKCNRLRPPICPIVGRRQHRSPRWIPLLLLGPLCQSDQRPIPRDVWV